jgi:hypothetical protein
MNDNKIRVEIDIWARKWNSKLAEISKAINRLCEVGLITIENEFMAVPSSEPRLNLIRGGKKGGEISKPIPKPMPKPTPKGDANQKKIKEKERESKSAKAISPTLLDVVNFFEEKGYTEEHAKKAFEYYDAAGWHDSRGFKVKNWKQKMIAVWMKDTTGLKPKKIDPQMVIDNAMAGIAALQMQYPDEDE